MPLYLLKVHLRTFLSIPITQKCQILSCDTLVANERCVDIAFFYSEWRILKFGTPYAEHSIHIWSTYLCQATFINIWDKKEDSLTCLTQSSHLKRSSNCMWSQSPCDLRRRSSGARLLRSWVRIPAEAWMFVCCECCVLSGRGLCDGLISRPEESYRLWRVVVCDQETLKTRRLKPATGLWKIQPQWVVTPGKQTTNSNCMYHLMIH
jgi:hypothetical protein